MGRRKIEIKAIKDDRNRSVTFLKRKGGLFKKAHELSVLCSVDVAVIIFGHNKKLYEFSSGDIHETIGRYQYDRPRVCRRKALQAPRIRRIHRTRRKPPTRTRLRMLRSNKYICKNSADSQCPQPSLRLHRNRRVKPL
ncbi:putative srf-type transcription factor [Diplodia seriata]|uniref:Putative srf-type transcription factor n=1 Tax=Diplodia seriata TaxID=420778 RepID=A0A0G2GJ08_9PEZI|nr:putative srf-type transcription factor [Diplodia seriata]